MTIYFDMDGTLANLYAVENWLPKLRNYDPSPYMEAIPMLDLRVLAHVLNQLQREGYKLGIISWLSKGSTLIYDEAVRTRKLRWLKKHLGSIQWDELHLVKYGRPKHYIAEDKSGILFDDNAEIRNKWKGKAYTEKEILPTLKTMLK